jgi:hypothetical protein
VVPTAHCAETSSSGAKHRFYRYHPMLHSKAYLLDMGDDKAATPGQASQAHHRLLGTARGERQAGSCLKRASARFFRTSFEVFITIIFFSACLFRHNPFHCGVD